MIKDAFAGVLFFTSFFKNKTTTDSCSAILGVTVHQELEPWNLEFETSVQSEKSFFATKARRLKVALRNHYCIPILCYTWWLGVYYITIFIYL